MLSETAKQDLLKLAKVRWGSAESFKAIYELVEQNYAVMDGESKFSRIAITHKGLRAAAAERVCQTTS